MDYFRAQLDMRHYVVAKVLWANFAHRATFVPLV